MAIRRIGSNEQIVLDQATQAAQTPAPSTAKAAQQPKLRKLAPDENIMLDSERERLTNPRYTDPVYFPKKEVNKSIAGHAMEGLQDAGRRIVGLSANLLDTAAGGVDAADTALTQKYYDIVGYPEVDPTAVDTVSAYNGSNAISRGLRDAAGAVSGLERKMAGRQEAMNVQDSVSYDDVKADPISLKTGRFILEQGARSLPEMGLAMVPVVGAPLVAGTTTQNIIEDRNAAQGRDANAQPTGEDLTTAAKYAIPSALLERAGVLGDIGKFGTPATSAAGIPSRMLMSGLGEAGTEFAQENLEFQGSIEGTGVEATMQDRIDRGIQGALVGGPMGATVRGGTEAANLLLNSKQKTKPAAQLLIEGATEQDMGTDAQEQATGAAGTPPPPAAPVAPAAQVQVKPNRDDLADAIANDTELPKSKIIDLPQVDIEPILQEQGYVVGAPVEQVFDTGEVISGNVTSAQIVDGELEVTMIDNFGNLRTLFASDGDITVPNVTPQVTAPEDVGDLNVVDMAQPIENQEISTTTAEVVDAPPVAEPKTYADMDLPELTTSLEFLRNQAKQTGWGKMLSDNRKQIENELNTRFPEWDAPKNVELTVAAQDVNPEPTDAQKEAGNYRKGHVSIQGLGITIENPKGSVRSGKDAGGQEWSVEMPAHYGYVKRTVGADSEQIDAYIGDAPSSDTVYVIDQVHSDTKKFDEHKVMVGFRSREEAEQAYQAAFSDGRGADRMGALTEMPMADFKEWLKTGNNKKAVAYKKPKPQKQPEQAEAPQEQPSAAMTGDAMARDMFGDFYDTLSGEQKGDFVLIAVRYRQSVLAGKADPIAARIMEAFEIAETVAAKEGGADIAADLINDAIAMVRGYSRAISADGNAPVASTKIKVDEKRLGAKIDAAHDFLDKVQQQPEPPTPSQEDPAEPSKEPVTPEVTDQPAEASPFDNPNFARTKGLIDDAIAAKNISLLRNILGNLDNKTSRLYFQKVTNTTLPKTVSGTLKAVDDYFGIDAQQRSKIDEQKAGDLYQEKQKKALLFYGAALAKEKIKEGDKTVTAKEWVDNAIADGYDKIVKRGPKYFLVRADGAGYPLSNMRGIATEVRLYAEAAIALKEDAPKEQAENIQGGSGVRLILTRDNVEKIINAVSNNWRFSSSADGHIQVGPKNNLDGWKVGEKDAIISALNGVGMRTTDSVVKQSGKSFKDPEASKSVLRVIAGEQQFAPTGFVDSYIKGLSRYAEPRAQQTTEAPAKKIEDFGEKLHGAAKDLWSSYNHSLTDELPSDVAEITLSKHFPEPKYDEMIAAGVSVDKLAAVKALRDQIGAKPRQSWKLKKWVSDLQQMRELANSILSGDGIYEKFVQKGERVRGLSGFFNQVHLYQKLGYPAFTKAKGWNIHKSTGAYENGVKIDRVQWFVSEKNRYGDRFETYDDALSFLKKKLTNTEVKPRTVTLDIYRVTATKDIIIGKKVGTGKFIDLKGGFTSGRDARAYLNENYDDLIELLKKKKDTPPMRRSTNDPRIGEDYRNGDNITPEVFSDTFGFRGVQFGNYVEQDKRVSDLNNAFDALTDMARVLGVPERALSLDGRLGLAFGARGKGGKNAPSAHYEPGNAVINLTKNAGAGSLGHEWWHALDNYFGKKNEGGMMTDSPRAREGLPVRQEVVDAYKDLVADIKKNTDIYKRSKELDKTRSKDYWSTNVEMTARAFEAYLIHKADMRGGRNDYLANISNQIAWDSAGGEGTYPYPLRSEMDVVVKAFDKLFEVIETRQSGDNIAMFSRSNAAATGLQSQLIRAVSDLKQAKGTGAQMLAMISKAAGVKEEEIAWTGLDEFLNGRDSVTKAEIVDYLDANQVRIEEVTLAQRRAYYRVEERDGRFWVVDDVDGGFYLADYETREEAQKIRDALAAENDVFGDIRDRTKFSQYTLPGGENYREVLLTLPAKDTVTTEASQAPDGWGTTDGGTQGIVRRGDTGADYRSSHFDQPNVLAHIRMNDRTDADGKKVLFIEEIQSDWHQAGRKRGYRNDPDGQKVLNSDGRVVKDMTVPEAPFKKTWHEMAFRRAVQMAAQGGYDRVAWTTGEQQNERYDLSKHVDKIQYQPRTKTFDAWKDGEIVISKDVEEKDLPDVIGKEASDRLLKTEANSGRNNDKHELSGIDLRFGGEGMKGFYDKILPTYAKKFGKKFGADVGSTRIVGEGAAVDYFLDPEFDKYRLSQMEDGKEVPFGPYYDTADEAADAANDINKDSAGSKVHSLDITPAMREAANAGFAMFRTTPNATVDKKLSSEMSDAINKRLNTLGWPQANFQIYGSPDQLMPLTGLDESVEGFYWRGVVYVSMNAEDVLATINHEVVHGLKAIGAFTDAEWSTLESRAKEWRKKYDIDRRYEDVIRAQGVTNPALLNMKLNEEAIAHAFQDESNKGPIRRIANRILAFLKAIGDVLRGAPYNFNTAEEVFRAVETGKIGKRNPDAPANAMRTGQERTAREKENYAKLTEGMPKDLDAFDPSDPVMFQLPKARKAALDKAGETLANLRGLDNNLRNDLGRVSAVVLHPQQIASLFKGFTPVYNSVIERFRQREVLIHQLSRHLDLYNGLKPDTQRRVNAVLDIGRHAGKTYTPAPDGTITVKNEGLKNAGLSKDGDTITLNQTETAAYIGVRNAMDAALDKYMESVLEEFGLLEQGVKNAQDVEKLRLKAKKDGNADEVARLKEVLQRLNDVMDAKKNGYIPFKRWGEVGISVKNKDGDVIHFERIELPKGWKGLLKKRRIGDNKAVQEAVARLGQKYNSKDYDINSFEINNFSDVAANVDWKSLDILAQTSEMNSDEYRKFKSQLKDEEKKKGFRSHFIRSKDVPGYSEDFERAFNDYIVTISSYISRRMNESKIEAALGNLAETSAPRLYDYGRNYVDYTNDPKEEIVTIRTLGFFWYLAGNISSGLVNLTQVPLVTAHWLRAKFNYPQIGKAMAQAYADTATMTDPLKAGMDFYNFEKAPKDVRAALIKAYEEGDFISMATQDAMALSNSTTQALRGVSKAARMAQEALALTFSVPEKINRIATFITAYRLALDPKNQEKIRKWVKNDEFAKAALDGKTGEDFAFAYAQLAVVSTQYRVGKLNRPKIGRGIGSLVFQFWSFMAQTFELMYKMGTVSGGQSKAAVGMMLFTIVALAGFKGIPFEDDLQDLFEKLYKFRTGKDLDIDTKIREYLTEKFGPFIAETIIKGLPASVANIDLSGRLGFGNIAPDKESDLFGVWYDMLVQRPLRAAEYANQGAYLRAFSEVMPAFIRNPITAYEWSEDGVRTQRGAKVIDKADVSNTDLALKALGFTSADISRKRDFIFARQRASYAVDDLRSRYYTQIAKTLAERKRRFDDGDLEGVAEMDALMRSIRDNVNRHNQTSPIHERVILNEYTIKQKAMEELMGAEAKRTRKQARPRGEELKAIYGLDGG